MELLAQAVVVFAMTLAVNVMYTVRLIVILRGRRYLGTVIALVESFTFAYSFARVLDDLGAWPLTLAYCLGTSAGSYAGMVIEEHFLIGHVRIKIIVPNGGEQIATTLRSKGYEVIQTLGTGKQGMVTLLHSIVDRRDADYLVKLVEGVNPKAFITIEEQTVFRKLLRAARGVGKFDES